MSKKDKSKSYPQKGTESDQSYASTVWELIDKRILSKKTLPFFVIIIIVGWVIIQDNGAGKLVDWNSLLWTLQKCGGLFGLYLVFVFIQWLYQEAINMISNNRNQVNSSSAVYIIKRVPSFRSQISRSTFKRTPGG